jgi:hypothetical protein
MLTKGKRLPGTHGIIQTAHVLFLSSLKEFTARGNTVLSLECSSRGIKDGPYQ